MPANEGWAAWQKWGDEVTHALSRKADSAELSAAVDAILSVIERVAKALKDERRARELLAATVHQVVQEIATRTTRLELGGGLAGAPTLSAAETATVKMKLRQALAISLDAVAAQRLAAGGPEGLRLHGEAHGEVRNPE